jgi:hypothetical protein
MVQGAKEKHTELYRGTEDDRAGWKPCKGGPSRGCVGVLRESWSSQGGVKEEKTAVEDMCGLSIGEGCL